MHRFKVVSRSLTGLVILLGALALAGWVLNMPVLKSILPGLAPMQANTALCLILAGNSLWLLSVGNDTRPRLFRWLAQICTASFLTLALVTLVEYVSGWKLAFDQILIPEAGRLAGTAHPGRMGPNTAVCFLLLAITQFWSSMRQPTPNRARGIEILGSLVTILGLVSIIGRATNITLGYGWWQLTGMAVPTGLAFMLMGVAIVLWEREKPGVLWTLEQAFTLSLAVALFFLAAIGLAGWQTTQMMTEAAKNVQHSREVIGKLYGFLADLLNIETGRQGFMITGEEQYLEPCQAGSIRLNSDLAQLRELT